LGRTMSVRELAVPADAWAALNDPSHRVVAVCGGTGCNSSESAEVGRLLREEMAARGLADQVEVRRTGCFGFCAQGPIVVVHPGETFYTQVSPSDVSEIVREHVVGGRPVARLFYFDLARKAPVEKWHDIDFYGKQNRVLLRNCGVIDPENIDHYLARDGYRALHDVLSTMTPEQTIETVITSGLRGRGGGGFPTGLKWRLARQTEKWPKYVICNADEGDPGAFMDRSALEGDPHSVVEGMIIAAYAIGARHGYVYCRAEYPLAVARLRTAISHAVERGLLGDHILGSDFSFDLEVKEGAGAFVCGEETALMASIQGDRGQPWPRPPYPAVSGVWGQPSNVNNVKSYAYVPSIIRNGPDWFRSLGTEGSPGTAVFALSGMVNSTGLIEVPMGITLGEIIYEVGGGIPEGRKFRAVQTGGPLGGCLPEEYLETPVDFDSLRAAGAVMGSGGMVVADETTCMVEFAKYFMRFVCDESCGKCPPCRLGSTRMLEILERITSGRGELEDLDRIRRVAEGMQKGSLCALGQLAASPVLSVLRHFEDDFVAHIKEARCPAAGCQMLVRSRCVSACPAGVDVPAYLALVAQGRYAEALAAHRDSNPFALVCSRVCPAFCERRCRRGDIDEPIAIRQAKRLMADKMFHVPWLPPKMAPDKHVKVAVIGSGPCGLTAALRLEQRGYQVTVFERMPLPGGMMTYGIPSYRLPREELFAEIDHIWRAGVEFRPNQELGGDFTIKSLMDEGYKAVVLALGAHRSRRLGVEGEDRGGVYHAVQMLRDIASGDSPDLSGRRVVVVGGGDTAMDAARSAWRLGAAGVTVVYRRERSEMPATREEIEGAEEEGVRFEFLVAPVAVIGDAEVTGVRLQRQSLGDYDPSGRRRPVPVPGTEFDLACDILVPAIGQITWVEDESLGVHRSATFEVGKAFELHVPGVFAAGDAVSGPGTVVQSVGHGNLVAKAVDAWITTGELSEVYLRPVRHDIPQLFDLDDYAEARRPVPVMRPPEARSAAGSHFAEVEMAADEATVREECKRCLRCDLEWLDRIGEPLP
jgi:NADH-quinone oxidoreductase subunit F